MCVHYFSIYIFPSSFLLFSRCRKLKPIYKSLPSLSRSLTPTLIPLSVLPLSPPPSLYPSLLLHTPKIDYHCEVSARSLEYIDRVFRIAEKVFTHPKRPLFDPVSHSLNVSYARALNRVFRLFDADADHILKDDELNSLMSLIFGSSLSGFDIEGLKNVVAKNTENGVLNGGVTFEGFLYLNKNLIQQGKSSQAWSVLSRFGYAKDLSLVDGYCDPPSWYVSLSLSFFSSYLSVSLRICMSVYPLSLCLSLRLSLSPFLSPHLC